MAARRTPTRTDTSRYAARDRRAEHLFTALAQATDPVERDRLVSDLVALHLDLCDGMASHYAGRRIPQDDLVQVARLALVVAIGRYRPGSGSSFVSYALPTISGELKRHFRDHGWMIRPPRRLQELGPHLRSAREQWEQQHGATPTTRDLAAELGVDAGQVAECLSAGFGYHPLSIDVTFDGAEGQPLASALAGPDLALESVVDRVCLTDALDRLAPDERELIELRFVDGLTQEAIGGRLGVSQMQVSRLIRSVLRRLREMMDEPATDLTDRVAV